MCSLDLDGTPGAGGVATATFPTTKGDVYDVGFLFSGNGACAPRFKVMIVAAAGKEQTFTWDIAGHHDAQHGFFQEESWSFTAAGAQTSIAFVSRDPKPQSATCGPVLTAVSVTKGT